MPLLVILAVKATDPNHDTPEAIMGFLAGQLRGLADFAVIPEHYVPVSDDVVERLARGDWSAWD